MGSIFKGQDEQRFPEWEDVKYSFVKDGGLRDIRLPNIKANDFPKFFDFLTDKMDSVEYVIEGEKYELPKSFQEYHTNAEELGAKLGATFGRFEFNCHSCLTEYLELDFWPYSVTRENLSGFLELLLDLGRMLSQDLIVTDEGPDEDVFIRYSFATDSLFQVSKNLTKKRNCSQNELAELSQRD